ncbi:MAG: tyrosine-type recombinase/integrase [Alphaproteobacteria bacterium]|nr:tyrosine-type recombinase/integrase [Alphaproteobacteria bacterium]
MKLTDTACKAAKPKEKPYRLADGGGLYLEITPTGSKLWRMKYRVKVGDKFKEKRLSLGIYPTITLAEAREGREKAKKLLAQGIDPSTQKQEEKKEAARDAQNTFKALALEWHENFKDKWTKRHADTVLRRLEMDIFPEIGSMPITEIRPSHIIAALKKVQKRGAYEPAHRLRQYCAQVFRHAIIHEIATANPAAEIGAVLKPVKKSHYACLDIKEIPELLNAIDRNDARLHTDTRLAIRLLMLTFVRTKELIEAKWEEFDLDNAQWVIPAERMKMRNEHVVPLSRQAVDMLKDLKERNERWEWVFPGHHSPRKHMSNNTILKGLARLGFQGRMTGHGFRALAMSTIKEKLNYRHEVIDRQLAHAPQSMVQRAYDRAKFLDERKVMMQDWADYLDNIAQNGTVIVGKFARKA